MMTQEGACHPLEQPSSFPPFLYHNSRQHYNTRQYNINIIHIYNTFTLYVTAKTHRYNNNARNNTIQILRQLVEPPSSQVLGVLLYPSSNQTCKHKLQINKQGNKRPTNIPTEVLILFLLISVLVKVVDEGVGKAIVVG